MRRALVGVACLAFASLAVSAGLSYAEALARSDRDEASLSAADTETLLAAHAELIGNAVMACMDQRNPPAKILLGVIMELDAQGRVVRTWRRDEDPLTTCFERHTMGTLMLVPPRVPFYTGIDLDLDVKSDE